MSKKRDKNNLSDSGEQAGISHRPQHHSAFSFSLRPRELSCTHKNQLGKMFQPRRPDCIFLSQSNPRNQIHSLKIDDLFIFQPTRRFQLPY